jgi:hypothetical protein
MWERSHSRADQQEDPMRRAVQAWMAGGALLAAAGCGITMTPSPVASPAPSAAAPPAAGSLRSTCEAVGQAYGDNLGPFAKALTELADARQQAGDEKALRREVQRSLTALATALRAATRQSTDPRLRADGEQTAERLRATATDAGFLRTVKTDQDVQTVLGPTLKQWLSPVTQHCS